MHHAVTETVPGARAPTAIAWRLKGSMDKIRIAVIGIGNCASSLLQGIEYYRNKKSTEATGLMHWAIGGFTPSDIEMAAAFDIDTRKVGRDVDDAIFAKPNCTAVFCPTMPKSGVSVRMGRVLDGVADHMKDYEDEYSFVVAQEREPSHDEVVAHLRDSGAEILLNYLPVGSEEATILRRVRARCRSSLCQ